MDVAEPNYDEACLRWLLAWFTGKVPLESAQNHLRDPFAANNTPFLGPNSPWTPSSALAQASFILSELSVDLAFSAFNCWCYLYY